MSSCDTEAVGLGLRLGTCSGLGWGYGQGRDSLELRGSCLLRARSCVAHMTMWACPGEPRAWTVQPGKQKAQRGSHHCM